jgi:hypothetical protein
MLVKGRSALRDGVADLLVANAKERNRERTLFRRRNVIVLESS